jgi:hypothetical protein
MIKLLEYSILNEDITHFVFLSGNCIPIYDYTYVSMYISQLQHSSFHLFSTSKRLSGFHLSFLPHATSHSQWCILDRNAAEALILNDMTSYFKNVSIPDEIYFATVLKFMHIHIDNNVTTCVNWKMFKKRINGRSPHTYDNISHECISEALKFYPKALFFRKVNQLTPIIPYNVKTIDTSRLKNPHIISFISPHFS